MSDKRKQTLAQEYQALMYGLFQEKLFSLEGIKMDDPHGIPEEYIPKSIVIEKAVELLNEVGQIIASDRRLTDEVDSGESGEVSEEAKAG